jgi:hypothetical protein
MHQHERDVRYGVMNAVCNTIRQLQASGMAIVTAKLYETDDEAEALAEEQRQIDDHVKRGIKLVNWWIGNKLLAPMDRKQTKQTWPPIPQMTQAHKEMLERATNALRAAAGEQPVDVQEPSPMRRHLIELAAKRDWRAWTEFLPIFDRSRSRPKRTR